MENESPPKELEKKNSLIEEVSQQKSVKKEIPDDDRP